MIFNIIKHTCITYMGKRGFYKDGIPLLFFIDTSRLMETIHLHIGRLVKLQYEGLNLGCLSTYAHRSSTRGQSKSSPPAPHPKQMPNLLHGKKSCLSQKLKVLTLNSCLFILSFFWHKLKKIIARKEPSIESSSQPWWIQGLHLVH